MNEDSTRHVSHWYAGLVVAACWISACSLTIADPDLWGHTLYGLRALERQVPAETTDPFSYTAAGAEWVNHEWLVEWQFGWLYREFGNGGLWWWRNVVIAIPFAVAFWTVRRSSSTAGIVAVFVPLAICLSQFSCFVRPQLATYALLAATLAIARGFVEERAFSRTAVWAVPPLIVLWTNLHGGFLAGLGILLITWCELLRRSLTGDDRWGDVTRFGIVLGLSVLGTLATPYGIRLHSMLWYHLGTPQIVSEWQPVWATRRVPAYFVPFLLPPLALLGSRRWTWLDLAWLLVIAVQAALHLKHVALLCTAGLILLPVPMSDAVRRLLPRIHDQWSGEAGRRFRVVGIVAMLSVLGLLQARSALPMWRAGIPPWEVAVSTRGYVPGVPLRAVREIRRAKLQGNLATDYGWAQFLIWQLYPDCRIAFDGRYRTIYPPAIERDYVAFISVAQPDEEMRLLDAYDTEIVLLSQRRTEAIAYVRSRDDWETFYEDDQAVVFVRRGRFPGVIAEDVATIPAWVGFPGDTTPEVHTRGNTNVSIR